jgi:hypothetical protein
MDAIKKNKAYFVGYTPKKTNVEKLAKYIAEKTLPNSTLKGKPKSNKRFQ